MSESQEYKKKFDNILEEFLLKRKNIWEIIIKEWKNVFFEEGGDWNNFELDWEINDNDIFLYQKDIIIEKKNEEDHLVRVQEEINTKWYYNFSHTIKWVPFRINWSIWRDKNYMRIKKLPSNIMPPKDIWIPLAVQDTLREYKNGWLIVIASPTWQWKTTSALSLVQDISKERCCIVTTLEDPIEYLFDSDTKSCIQQRELWFDFDTYSSWIKSCIRQSNDIIFIHELTSHHAIQSCINALSKWKLIVTTINATDTEWIFSLLVNWFPAHEQQKVLLILKRYLRCFLTQKLIRKKDGTWKVAVFEYLLNTPMVKWYIEDNNTKNIHQIMEMEKHLLMSRDIYDRMRMEDIWLEDAIANCPQHRLNYLKNLIWMDD